MQYCMYNFVQLTGTVFSSCILYLRSAAGFPVRSRMIKNMFPTINTTMGTRDEPVKQTTATAKSIGSPKIFLKVYWEGVF